MGKRNKVRYTAKEVQRIEIILTGSSWVQFLDEDISARAAKGDVLFYAHYSGQSSPAVPDYEVTGYVGYLKMDVFDGKKWCPLLPAGLFDDGEQHFKKSERASDTLALCTELISQRQGAVLLRTYREHYTLDTHAD